MQRYGARAGRPPRVVRLLLWLADMAGLENDAKGHRDVMERALRKLQDADRKLKAYEQEKRERHEPIAILGIGCRLPGGVDSPEGFWDALMAGFHPVENVPKERFDIDAYFDADPDRPGTMYARCGAFVRDIDRFDPALFGISPREAEAMDPQHRLLLEVTWEALERAGLVPRALRGSTAGVYVGLSANDYAQLATRAPHAIDAHTGAGNSMAAAAGRLAYTFGFEGPAMTVDTACSASLVAVHLACQGLLSGDAELAIAAGVNLVLSPVGTLIECRARMLSPDGVCRTFDAAANGIVRGEGCGVVVLKRLSLALRDRDPIVAVIQGTAVNQDGRSGGLTVPNGPAQQRVIAKALQRAGVRPHEVGYVEAHGTGTPLGDPIEIEALGESYCAGRAAESPLWVGSVKTNIGHLEGAAGIVGLIKAALCVQRAAIPRHLHMETPNPHIDWSTWALRVATERAAWPDGYAKRYAAVSSFGFSGTNAHAILAQAPASELPAASAGPLFLPLSAGSAAGLAELARRYRKLVTRAGEQAVRVEDVCFTATFARTHHAHRLAITGRDAAELVHRLDEFLATQGASPRSRAPVERGTRPVAFLFTGQGAQYAGMGRDLWLGDPAFRDAWERCNAIVLERAGFGLTELVFGEGARDAALLPTGRAQPALFALEYALSRWWRARGVVPSALLGYSLGEYVAAHLAGVFSLEDALQLVCERGRLMQSLGADGAMAAIELDESSVRQELEGYEPRLAIASINGPTQIVLSGYEDALSAVLAKLRTRGVRAQRLRVSHAFHSPQMDAILEPFRKVVEGIVRHPARVPLVSNLTGAIVRDEVVDSEYWVRHLRSTVRFADGLDALEAHGQRVFVEIGPKPTLLGLVRRRENAEALVCIPSLQPPQDDLARVWSALGAVYEAGGIDSFAGSETDRRNKRDCPTYPFDRKSYWLMKENRWFGESDRGHRRRLALSGKRVRSAAFSADTLVLELEVSATAPAFLAQHRIGERPLMPATGYIEMALAMAEELPGVPRTLESLELLRPLVLDDAPRVLQVVVKNDGSAYAFEILSHADEQWALHARGRLAPTQPRPDALTDSGTPEDAEDIDLGQHFQDCRARGIEYGPAFRGLMRAARRDGEAWADVRMPEEIRVEASSYVFHPAILDACLQLFAIVGSQHDDERTFVPVNLERFRCWASGSEVRRVQLKLRPDTSLADAWMWDERGQLVATVEGLFARPLMPKLKAPWADWLFETRWQSMALGDMTADPLPAVERWVVFADEQGVGQGIADELLARGVPVTTVSRGLEFATGERGGFVMSPRRPDHFQRLLETLRVRRGERLGIAYLWSLEGTDDADPRVASKHALQGALLLAQALAERAVTSSRLVFVTQRCQAVRHGDVPPLPAQALLWGFAQALRHELSDAEIGLVDLGQTPTSAAPLVDWMQRFSNDDRVAMREDRFYVPRLTRLDLEPDVPNVPVREDASYLVTGGCGALGLETTRWLIARGASRIYLLARRKPSDTVLADIAAMGNGTVQVEVVMADVTDAARVRELVAAVPDLRGIVHAAGALSDALLPRQSWSEMDRVLAPKVSGVWNLHGASEKLPLDFFIVFGSIAGTLGNVGQTGYCAANAFLDAFAHHRREGGLPVTTVAWGSWGKFGMAARASTSAPGRGYEPIDAPSGFAALDAVVGSGRAQACIAPMQWPTWLREHRECSRQAVFSAFSAAGVPDWNAASDLRQRLDEAPASAVQSIVREHVSREVGTVLKLDADDLAGIFRVNLMERGMDSLMAVELRNRLSRAFDRPLPATLLFFNPTVQALADYLTELEVSQKPAVQELGASKTHESSSAISDEVRAMTERELQRLIHDAWTSLQNGSPSR
ncbi:type I polyketide synthase [Pendulispora rubella]|uniref:Type I polyketide synthase n=1 Tax=Pendulispora rubella TaxID=2741070 RepID=A0ABZ2L3E6_9BACT